MDKAATAVIKPVDATYSLSPTNYRHIYLSVLQLY